MDDTINICSTGKVYNNEKAIISLTSWKARINTVHITIESLLKHCSIFHIVLCLAVEEFPNKEKDLPQNLTQYIDKIEIMWVDKNYGAYKKVLFTLYKYQYVPVISCDDDMIITSDYFSIMYDKWCSNRGAFITGKDHSFEEVKIPIKSDIKHTSGSCTLYPPYIFGDYGLKCVNNQLLQMPETDPYYSALKYYLDKCDSICIPSICQSFEFMDISSDTNSMSKKYMTVNRGIRRKQIFDIVKTNVQYNILHNNCTILTANFNSSDLTQALIQSIRKQLGFNIHVTIIDNSTTEPWDHRITENVSVIDNTNFKLTPNLNQASYNHASSIDYALKHIDKEWVILCDCDVLFKPQIKYLLQFTHRDFDICGQIGHDVLPNDRLLPYLCIINNKKLQEHKIDFYDDKTNVDSGYDTGYSLLINAQNEGLNIKNIDITEYSIHLKGAILRNKDYISWLKKNEDLWR